MRAQFKAACRSCNHWAGTLLAAATICSVGAEKPTARVRCETSVGGLTIDLHESWAPLGYKRFVELVEDGFFTDQIVYRVIPGFLLQFGVAADPAQTAKWARQRISDDPKLPSHSFRQGTVSFAGAGPNSRTSHIFIGLDPNVRGLGNAAHERPFGQISDPDEAALLSQMYAGYGDLTRLQGQLVQRGNPAADPYPKLSRFQSCAMLPDGPGCAEGWTGDDCDVPVDKAAGSAAPEL